MEETPYYVNMYRKTDYMLNSKKAPELAYGTAAQLADVVRFIFIHHMLGSGAAETEHLLIGLHTFIRHDVSHDCMDIHRRTRTGKGLFANKKSHCCSDTPTCQ